jgi:hypothetical protein
MFTRIAFTILGIGSSLALQAQQPPAAVDEPQYMYQVAALNLDGSLLTLESQKLTAEHETHNRFVYVQGSAEQTVPGEHSPIRVGGNAVFVIKWVQGMDAIDPNTMVKLRPFVIQKGMRALSLRSGKAVIFSGTKSQSTPDNSLAVTFKKYGQNSLLITPQTPLAPGEYVLEANGGFAGVNCFGVDAGLSGSGVPPPQAKPAGPPPQPAWRSQPFSDAAARSSGAEVRLSGTAEAGSFTSAGQLVLRCESRVYDTGPATSVRATIEVGPRLVDFDTSAMDGPAAENDGFGRSQLIGQPEITLDTVYLGKSDSGNPMFQLEYEWKGLKQIVDTSKAILTASVMAPENKGHTLRARFALPADTAPANQTMSACFQKFAAAEEAIKARTVASCPVKTGDILDMVTVKYADTGKPVKGEPDEMDNGASWTLPQPAKGHAARKIVMICQYNKAGDAGTQGNGPDKETVPIPATARSCDFSPNASASRSSATCLSAALTNAAAAPASPSAVASAAAMVQTSAQAQRTSADAPSAAAGASLPSGPIAPVNKLNVRGISVRMGRNQILAAAKAANMRVIENVPSQLKLIDATASGRPTGDDSGSGGSGLILLINLANDAATSVMISEQGDNQGHVFDDLCKKWGKPSHLPSGYDSQLGTGDPAAWGDKKDVYASYNPNMYGFGGQHVTIYDAVALTPHVPTRKSVPM